MKSPSPANVHRSLVLWLLSGIFACLGIVAYFATSDIPDYQAFSFAISLTATLLHGSAAVFYLRGLHNFKTNLRIAYVMLSSGIAVLGVAIGQLPIINRFGLSFWSDSGLMLIPYLLAVYLIFGGVRQFARSLKLQSRWFSYWLATATAVAVGAVTALLPHVRSELAEVERLASVALTAVIAIFFVFAARGVLLIKQAVGASYSFGLAWLSIAIAAAAVAAVHYIGVLQLTPGNGHYYYDWSISILLFNVTGWLFMKAGYAFCTINETVASTYYPRPWRPFFGLSAEAPKKADDVQTTSSVDIIVYAMSMASDPSKVDKLVDDMRVITAGIGKDKVLTAHDQSTLLRTYQRLEDYLVNDEPLRSFDRQQVRQNIEKHFGLDSDDPTVNFWPQVADN